MYFLQFKNLLQLTNYKSNCCINYYIGKLLYVNFLIMHSTMTYLYKPSLFAVLLILVIASVYNCYYYPLKPAVAKIARSRGTINIDDPNLKYEVVASGLKSPTTMAFLGPNDILVNEKLN